jgi:hypothetical protein
MRAISPQVVLAMQMVRLYSLLLGILIFQSALLWDLIWVPWALKVLVHPPEVVVVP